MPNTTTDLYTTVKNTSGATAVFSFLGTHGRRLENNETYTVPGDLVGALGAKRSRRAFQAMERALNSGALSIVKSPSLYLLSETGNVTKELAMNSSRALGTTDPSWKGGSAIQLDGVGATGASGPTGAAGATGATGPA
jgi:hypothetical protein